MRPRKRFKDEPAVLNIGSNSPTSRRVQLYSCRFIVGGIMLFLIAAVLLIHTLGSANQVEADDAYSKFFSSYAKPLLVPRPPGSENSVKVVQFLDDTLASMGYQVNRQTFLDKDPKGEEYNFTNVWTETSPNLPKLIFSCHHDTKVLPEWSKRGESKFVGAIDSSIPCAMVLQLAQLVSSASENDCKGIAEAKKKFSFVFLFFDGEEAFYRWTKTDSLYGSRYFASHIEQTQPGFIKNIKMFTLLDLIGAKDPSFKQTAESGSNECYRRLMDIEKYFNTKNGGSNKSTECYPQLKYNHGHKKYFTNQYMGGVEDDHLPFQRKGVPILHLISVPFPDVWHTMDDNELNLDHPSIENVLIILIHFIENHVASCVRK